MSESDADSFESDIYLDIEDDIDNNPIFCNAQIQDIFEYLSFVSCIDDREKLDAFQGLKFSAGCPCCWEDYEFCIQRYTGANSKFSYFELSVEEPCGREFSVIKLVGRPVDCKVVATCTPHVFTDD